MTDPAQHRRYDLAWSRGNQLAISILCSIFLLTLIVGAFSDARELSGPAPINHDLVAAAAERIDPNTASSASLQRLPGIGPARAEAIIEYRRTAGSAAFTNADDLAKVSGIGQTMARRIAPFVKFSSLAK